MRHYEIDTYEQLPLAGAQPRKFSMPKNKKRHSLFADDLDAFGKQRHGYNRSADKNYTRSLLRDDSMYF